MEEKIKKLEDLVARKEQEIKDIKFSISNILLQIRNINENESNEYSVQLLRKEEYQNFVQIQDMNCL